MLYKVDSLFDQWAAANKSQNPDHQKWWIVSFTSMLNRVTGIYLELSTTFSPCVFLRIQIEGGIKWMKIRKKYQKATGWNIEKVKHLKRFVTELTSIWYGKNPHSWQSHLNGRNFSRSSISLNVASNGICSLNSFISVVLLFPWFQCFPFH